MRWIKSIVVALGTMFLGMFGGQKNKGARRFGISGLSIPLGGFKRRAWPLVLLIPVLVIGYGENSWLYKVFGSDTLVRVGYASMLSFVFLFYGFRRFVVAWVLLVGAFQVRAGSLGHIGWFGDILIEDTVRYGVLGVLIAFNLFFVKGE